MNILLLDPYFIESHKSWAEGYQKFSKHKIDILSLSGHHWKWRMHGGAITLANQFLESDLKPDLILATDMLDLNTFLALTRKRTANIPVALYFHENQLTYPWSPTDEDVEQGRDKHYSFINVASALAADKVLFNSQYHHDAFLEELPRFLKAFPGKDTDTITEEISARSEVLPLGMDISGLAALEPETKEWSKRAVLLWNHRWEYDKNPDMFFNALYKLQEHGVDFRLIVLGRQFGQSPPIFEQAKKILADKILHWGYAETKEEYVKWLYQADIIPVTSNQDFFGASVVEALACNVKPLLPDNLAYPEHLPEAYKASFFYPAGNMHEYQRKLQRRIFDVRVLRLEKMRKFVKKYDWPEMASRYDDLFSDMVG